FGSTQCGSALAAAQTPNWNGCGVAAKLRAWSGLKPSWPVRTTVKPQPGPGVPSEAFEMLNVMKREIALPLIDGVPSVAPPASMKRLPKPCTSISRLQANGCAIV